MQKYHGKLQRWLPAIERWRKKGYSWPDIGHMLLMADVDVQSREGMSDARRAGALGQLAWHAHNRNALAEFVNDRVRRGKMILPEPQRPLSKRSIKAIVGLMQRFGMTPTGDWYADARRATDAAMPMLLKRFGGQ